LVLVINYQSKNMNPCINQYNYVVPYEMIAHHFFNRKITMKSPILDQCLTTAHLLLDAAVFAAWIWRPPGVLVLPVASLVSPGPCESAVPRAAT
jgi:hypothetical protein